MGSRGRPSKYRPEFVDKVNDYYLAQLKANNCPFLEDIATILGISLDSLERYYEAKKDFRGAIDKVKLLQRKWLKLAGLSGKTSAKMVIFLLKANHGMVEKSVIEHQGGAEEPVNIVIRPAPLNLST